MIAADNEVSASRGCCSRRWKIRKVTAVGDEKYGNRRFLSGCCSSRAIKLGKKIDPRGWLIILFFVISPSPGVDII